MLCTTFEFERSYNHQINAIIARHMPSLAEAVTRTFALGEASLLRSLFSAAGLTDFETSTVKHTFVLPSFDAYYGLCVPKIRFGVDAASGRRKLAS